VIWKVYTLYGVQIPRSVDWAALSEDPGRWRGEGHVGFLRAGMVESPLCFLVRSWNEVTVGRYTYHPGNRPGAPQYRRDRWEQQLIEEAKRLGVPVTSGPGWFTVPSEI
jgi:hypothetical protein